MPIFYLVNAEKVVGQVETETWYPAPYMRNSFFYESYEDAENASSLDDSNNTIWELRNGSYHHAYKGIPGINGVPPLTEQERASLWNGPPSPRFEKFVQNTPK